MVSNKEICDFLNKSPSKEEWDEFVGKLDSWVEALVFRRTVNRWIKDVDAADAARVRAERRTEKAKISPIDPSKAITILPRGLQILAFDTDNLTTGFPYPAALAHFHIPLEDWDNVLSAIIPPLYNRATNTLAKNIETVLDNIAKLDIEFFRPRGLIMRMDMPGEQIFGLDIMDLYHRCHRGQTSKHRDHTCKRSHVDNLSGAGTTNAYHKSLRNPEETGNTKNTELGAIRYNLYVSKRHLWRMRRDMYEGTRIVLDVLAVLNDPEAASKRGWTNWIKQCEEAKEKQPRVECNPRPSFSDPEAVKEYYEPFRHRPISERIFRWPPSKQLYYDRWRGDTPWLSCDTWKPYEDSMDKRMRTHWHPKCVVPADEIAVMVMEKNGPEDRCFETHKHMITGKFKGKKGPVYPGRQRRRRRIPGHPLFTHYHGLLSERDLALRQKERKEEAERIEELRKTGRANGGNDPCCMKYQGIGMLAR